MESLVLLILDNHIFHIRLPTIILASPNNIHMLTSPTYSNHKSPPPLNCNFFRPFSAFYDSDFDYWITSNPDQKITKLKLQDNLDRNKFTDENFLASEVAL